MKQAEEMGVAIPKYYKPGTFNPLSYAEQMQKRKMMWKKPGAEGPDNQTGAAQEEKKDITAPSRSNEMGPSTQPQSASKQPEQKLSFNKWEATNFGDSEANEKFRRLMGIRAAPKPEEVKDAAPQNSTKIMNDLEKNYEVARLQTHRARGVGLGFGGAEPVAQIPQEVESGPPPVGPHMGTRPPPTGQFHAAGGFRGPPPTGGFRGPPPGAFNRPPPVAPNFSEPPPRMSQPPPFPNHPTRPGSRPASSGISFVRKHY